MRARVHRARPVGEALLGVAATGIEHGELHVARSIARSRAQFQAQASTQASRQASSLNRILNRNLDPGLQSQLARRRTVKRDCASNRRIASAA
jgi:hypothetical protein